MSEFEVAYWGLAVSFAVLGIGVFLFRVFRKRQWPLDKEESVEVETAFLAVFVVVIVAVAAVWPLALGFGSLWGALYGAEKFVRGRRTM